jgi:hypothetical protein
MYEKVYGIYTKRKLSRAIILFNSEIIVESIKGKKITVFWEVTTFSLVKILRLSDENSLYIFREVE